MAGSSNIEWTDATWNPTTGCSRVSKGCDNCYAMHMARRLDGQKNGYDGTTRYTKRRGTDWTGVVKCHEDRLEQPLRWRKRRHVFVNSMSDLFHPTVPEGFVDKVFAVMALARRHTFQILTKRPERMAEYLAPGPELWRVRWPEAMEAVTGRREFICAPPDNIWLGTSVENEATLDRADAIRGISAGVRFLSLEPLIGPLPELNLTMIDWVIVGGESGSEARPMRKEWVTQIRDQCVAEGVPFFFKQWGGVNKKKHGRTLEGRTWDQMPQTTQMTSAV